MGTVVLLQALPMNPANGQTVAVRLAGGGGRPYVGYLGLDDWRSGLDGLPRFTTELGFDQSGWTGGAIPQTAVIGFRGADKALLSTLSNLFWKGARVVISSGDDSFGAPAAWVTEMTGTVAELASSGGAIRLTISDLSGDLAKPIVPDTFAGTGGVEGADDATGRVKRRSWGRVFNVEGKLIDKANNVYEFGDPARPLQAFDMLKDKGRAGDMTVLASQGSIAATFAALQAAACPSGGGVVAPSIAMAKWWTVPSGPLTADLRGETLGGYIETPNGITSRIIATRSTINPVLVVNASRTYPAGLHADDAGETVASALDRLLLPCSLVWSLSPAGQITVGEWTWTGSVETLVSQEVERETVFSPLLTRKLGFQKNQREQNDAEISSALLLAADATYADGTPIEVLKPAQAGADQTSMNTAAAIIAQGPGATAPGTAIFNSNVTIGADGKLIGAGGGQVTYGGVGGKLLGLFDYMRMGGPSGIFAGMFNEAGTEYTTDNGYRTALGSAAAILGQGPWATLSDSIFSVKGGPANVIYDGGLKLKAESWTLGGWSWTVGGDGPQIKTTTNGTTQLALTKAFNVNPNSVYTFQGEIYTQGQSAGKANLDIEWYNSAGTSVGVSPRITAPNGLSWAEYALTVTSPAQAVTGKLRIFLDQSPVSGLTAMRKLKVALAGEKTVFSDEATNGALYGSGQNIDVLKPEEIGGNRTETRSSASFFGQGGLATLNQVTLNSTTIRRADGTTIVSETLIITQLGTAAAIQGQGTGATANNLQQLDPAAKAQLDAAGGAATGLTAPFGGTINKVIENGASVTYEAAVYREAGGNSGSIYAQVVAGPSGGSGGVIGEGGAGAVTASEPGGSVVTGTFTNNTGVKQNFAFTATERRVPTTAGGAIRQSQSYLIIRG